MVQPGGGFSRLVKPDSTSTKAVCIMHNISIYNIIVDIYTNLPETNSSHLKMDGWNLVSFWNGLFSGTMLVSGRVYISSIFIHDKGWKRSGLHILKTEGGSFCQWKNFMYGNRSILLI